MGDQGQCPYYIQDKSVENYYRLCGLITTVCSDLLRDILSRHIEPADLRSKLNINRTLLEKRMNKIQKQKIYMTGGTCPLSAKELDISVLYMLLRNICPKIPAPVTGWDKPPRKGDNSISACIERIRQIRNKIQHHSENGRINDTDFQIYWDDLCDSVIETEKDLTGGRVYESGLRSLESMKLTKIKGENYNDDFQKSKDPEEEMIRSVPKARLSKSHPKKPRCSSNNKLVAAIDFGTTYSGHAYSLKGKFENDPLKIKAHSWSKSLFSHKTPTTALFDKDQKLIAFGYDAEQRFRELSQNGEHQEHYFFERFKMQLYNYESGDKEQKRLTKDSMIRDISGKELSALYVFSKAIEYMHDHLLEGLEQNEDDELDQENIHWVLTVPAIWHDSAKQFMRDAAEQAGIRSEKLTIALEPEAASMYCKNMQLEKPPGQKSDFKIFSPGNQYLILDAGGGTVDITIHEVLEGDRIKELHKPTGGPWGGIYLDHEFFNILEECVGKDEFEKFKRDDLDGYIDLCKDLELKKRDISTETQKMSLRIPFHLQSKCDISRSKFADRLVFRGEKIEFDEHLIKQWYSEVCDKIENHVRNLLEKHKIDIILMVGGFSESLFLHDTMKKAFPDKAVLVPNGASLAVLKGAVLFGHNPSSIESRVAKFTYGVNTTLPIKDENTVLDEKHFKIIDGVKYETNVFSKHVTKGDNLKVGEIQKEITYHPLLNDQKTIRFNVYTSSRENPKYIDDPECRPLGYINVDIPDSCDRKVLVRFIFGGTEIKVEGINERAGNVTSVKFQYSESAEEEQRYLCKPDV